MSVGISETEQRLRDDSALDLVRTAVDGALAGVEVGGKAVDGTVRRMEQPLPLERVGAEAEALRPNQTDKNLEMSSCSWEPLSLSTDERGSGLSEPAAW